MIIRKRYLALLFTAICLLGILPLSVSARTPAIEGATYTLNSPNLILVEPSDDVFFTPIVGQLNYFSCSGSADGTFETIVLDIFTSTITAIGYTVTLDAKAIAFQALLNGSMYVPQISPIPLLFDDVLATLVFYEQGDKLIVGLVDGELSYLMYAETSVNFTLTEILDTTDMTILNTTLEAFSTELTTDNYVNWMLGGYNSIIDVFVNNAKVQYVMDNPIFIIALVVFAMAISFAIATYIFKIFRRY